MSKKTFRTGQLVTFKYGARAVQGVIKEDRGPIGMKGRVLYLVEFRPEARRLTCPTLNSPLISSRKWRVPFPSSVMAEPAADAKVLAIAVAASLQ
jgi:hypothetical protein